MTHGGEIDALLRADDPSLRFLVRRDVLGEDGASRAMRVLQSKIRSSPRTTALLEGHQRRAAGTYGKWQGAHWVVLHLAQLGHPGGDDRVDELIDETLAYWTAPRYLRDKAVTRKTGQDDYVPVIAGKARRCASQQGGALLSAVRLGHRGDPRVPVLARRLCDWQWPDGGWNCDQHATARMSSVNESFLALRGLTALGGHEVEVARAAGVLPRPPGRVPAHHGRADLAGGRAVASPGVLALRPGRRSHGARGIRPHRRRAMRSRPRPPRVTATIRGRLAGRCEVVPGRRHRFERRLRRLGTGQPDPAEPMGDGRRAGDPRGIRAAAAGTLGGPRRCQRRQALDDQRMVVQLGQPGDDDDADGTAADHDQREPATVRCVLGEVERRRLGE